jgi:hypothetical protein
MKKGKITVPDDVLHATTSVFGHTIRVTARQWAHVTEAHDYMSGNLDKVLETMAAPEKVIAGEYGESLALRDYDRTNITRKTSVVVYRDVPDGFLITAFFTSKPEKVEKKGQVLWSQSREN